MHVSIAQFSSLLSSAEFQLLLFSLIGFVMSRMAVRVGGIKAGHTESEKALWSLIAGVLLAVPLLALSTLLPSELVTRLSDVLNQPLDNTTAQLTAGYLLLLLSAAFLGGLIGLLYRTYHRHRFGTTPTVQRAWSLLARRMKNAFVQVTTIDDVDIFGVTRYKGERYLSDSSRQQDLILKYPRRLDATSNAAENLGRYLYLSEATIRRVHFYSGSLTEQSPSRVSVAKMMILTTGTRLDTTVSKVTQALTSRLGIDGPQPLYTGGKALAVEKDRDLIDDQGKHVRIRYRNPTNGTMDCHGVRVSFLDCKNNHLYTGYDYVSGIGKYKNWTHQVTYRGSRPEAVADYTVTPIPTPAIVFTSALRLQGRYRKEVVGAVKNNSGRTVVYTELEVAFFDNSGHRLATQLGAVRNLQPGDKTNVRLPYHGPTPDEIDSFAYRLPFFLHER